VEPSTQQPTLRLLRGKEKLPRHFHPWIFSGALEPRDLLDLEPGLTWVKVVDYRGDFVGWGWPNKGSRIAIRLVSWQESEGPGTFSYQQAIEKALELRQRLGLLNAEGPTTAARLIFAEADGLPGLVVDRFGDWLVVQFETRGCENHREPLVETLVRTARESLPGLQGIIEKSDSDGRKLEGLAPRHGHLWGQSPVSMVDIRENGRVFRVDLESQKTGFYCDQRENREIVSRYCGGRRVIDGCAFTGGFSVYAATAGARELVVVDSSQRALDVAKINLEINPNPPEKIEYPNADVFSYFRNLEPRSQEVIIFDPPKLATKRGTKDRAMKAYKDGNLHALRALKPGGILATFSCSGLVSTPEFEQMIQYAVQDSQRRVQVVQHLSQAPCHPVPTSFPEASYLKGLVLRCLD